ncbi:MAG: Tim44-like domain-containing protein [Rhodoferax sp.]|nr:Tim44-like domain-containing protein [Rhodoferax sp.]
MMKWSVVFLSLLVTLGSMNAEAARRLGGGSSLGKQSGNVTQRNAVPAQPAAPAAPAQGVNNSVAKPGPAATPVQQPAPRRPWGAMLGGLAAGLGLAWLAHSLGMGEAFGQFLMVALLAMGVMLLIGWFMRKRSSQAVHRSPFAFQGAGASPAASAARSYRPENVGNDVSARPFERSSLAALDTNANANANVNVKVNSPSMIGSALMGSQSWGVPAGFDSDGFLRAAKANFVALQAAWDHSDIATLRSLMTDAMVNEIRAQLAEREAHTGSSPNRTEVVMLEAHLLGIEELAEEYMASVEFSGMIREDPSAGPSPFREVWNMTKPKAGGGWLVAGVQALQ